MTAIEVKAKVGGGDPVLCKKDFGDDLAQMVKMFGDAVVYSNALANMKISVQDTIRAGIRATDPKKTPAEIQKDVTAWMPGVKKRGKSKSEKIKDEFENLTADEKKELLARLTGN